MFGPRFFRGTDVPLLLIAGTNDVIVEPRRNARAVLAHVPGGTLVTIAGGSHTGFNDTAARLPRFAGNPDRLACWVLARTLRLDAAVAKYRALARESDVDLDAGVHPPCTEDPPGLVMHPARQQALTTLAVAAFLESHLARDPARRACARRYLAHTLPREVPEVEIARGPLARSR
jgi:predicted dienelactone hydrolase